VFVHRHAQTAHRGQQPLHQLERVQRRAMRREHRADRTGHLQACGKRALFQPAKVGLAVAGRTQFTQPQGGAARLRVAPRRVQHAAVCELAIDRLARAHRLHLVDDAVQQSTGLLTRVGRKAGEPALLPGQPADQPAAVAPGSAEACVR